MSTKAWGCNSRRNYTHRTQSMLSPSQALEYRGLHYAKKTALLQLKL